MNIQKVILNREGLPCDLGVRQQPVHKHAEHLSGPLRLDRVLSDSGKDICEEVLNMAISNGRQVIICATAS